MISKAPSPRYHLFVDANGALSFSTAQLVIVLKLWSLCVQLQQQHRQHASIAAL